MSDRQTAELRAFQTTLDDCTDRGLYRVEGACLIEATQETGILYRPEQGDATHILWMRPAVQFDDLVPTPNGTMRRFSPR